MNRRNCFVLAAALSSACFASGQNLAFQLPVSGLVFNRASGTIQAISGIPGAAALGAVILDGLQAADLSADGSTALVQRDDNVFFVTDLQSGSPVLTLIQELAAPYQVAWDGNIALIASGGNLSEVRREGVRTLALKLSALSVRALVFDHASRRVLVAAPGGVYGGAFDDPALAIILNVANPVGLVRGSVDAFVADGDTQEIFALRDFRGNIAIAKFPGVASDGSQISGLAASGDDQRVYAADQGLKVVAVYDAATGNSIASLPVNFAPNKLQKVSAGSLLLLKDDAGPLFVIADQIEPGVFFIPPAQESAGLAQ